MAVIKVRLLREGALPPVQKTAGSVGMDVYAPEDVIVHAGQVCRVNLGIAIELPRGAWAMMVGRSSLAVQGLFCFQGTIDNDYRGELCAVLYNSRSCRCDIEAGERIAQLVICQMFQQEIVISESLSDTDRGEGGFGSTGA